MSLLEHPKAQELLADATLTAADVHRCREHLTEFLKRYLPHSTARSSVSWPPLVAAGRPAVPFLAERLRPVARVEDERLNRLIGDLDSSQFQVRSRVSKQLQELGELAGPALRKALAAKPSLDVSRRLETLLQQMESQTLSAEQLRVLRALEVLEHVGTPAARQVLEGMAKGAPEAQLTQEAKASLERLTRRPGSR